MASFHLVTFMIASQLLFASSLEQDVDDLDLLASLVDSDSELLDDDIVGEAISSSNTSPQSATTAPVTGSQSQQGDREDGVQSGTTTNITMEEMAGK